MVPEWFRREIIEGLARLVALSLPGAPPADTIKLTRESWVESLWPGRDWAEHQDAARLRLAFRALCANAERWPAPTHLLRHLPARAQPRSLPAPVDPAQKQALREAVAQLKRKLRMP